MPEYRKHAIFALGKLLEKNFKLRKVFGLLCRSSQVTLVPTFSRQRPNRACTCFCEITASGRASYPKPTVQVYWPPSDLPYRTLSASWGLSCHVDLCLLPGLERGSYDGSFDREGQRQVHDEASRHRRLHHRLPQVQHPGWGNWLSPLGLELERAKILRAQNSLSLLPIIIVWATFGLQAKLGL